jgi:hypothetical protein
MPVDFSADSFTTLSRPEKKQIVFDEFRKNHNDFQYYLDNYAFIRHPNKGILKMKAFDFQLDVAVPISITLLNKRSEESNELVKLYKHRFDYEKWWNTIAEENIELSKRIPVEFHNFHRIASKSTVYNDRVDTILLKSRQTGLSTIFQQLCLWHTNFHGDVYDLIMSQGDREAIKFMSDIWSSYEELPAPIRAKKINGNEHELWLSVTGNKRRKSGIQALPPTPKAGRSFSPNLVILDEFAEYRNAEQVWTAISMSVSGGGIIVIIATPKGVGNLYHKIWEMTNKSISVTMPGQKDESSSSVFKPHVVHWSQLPTEEFTRRGFSDPVEWYEHMKNKLMLERGKAGVAQELDLNFSASGNTIDTNVIDALRQNCIESSASCLPQVITDHIPGLVVYELPEPNYEYVIGVDPAEGVGADFSASYVFKIPLSTDVESYATCVAYFSNNTIPVRRYTKIVKDIGILYNNSWLNIEKNNHGNVLLSYFIEEHEYNPDRIINRYDNNRNHFVKGVKGWNATKSSNNLLVATFLDHLISSNGAVSIPLPVVEELKTFINKGGTWEAQVGYHDDQIKAYALGHIGAKLLHNFKQFLINCGDGYVPLDIDDDMLVGSSVFVDKEDRKTFIEKQKEQRVLKSKQVVDPEQYKNPTKEIVLKRPESLRTQQGLKYQFMAQAEEEQDDDEYDGFPVF